MLVDNPALLRFDFFSKPPFNPSFTTSNSYNSILITLYEIEVIFDKIFAVPFEYFLGIFLLITLCNRLLIIDRKRLNGQMYHVSNSSMYFFFFFLIS